MKTASYENNIWLIWKRYEMRAQKYESQHDKINGMTVRPAKTQNLRCALIV